MPVLDNLFNEWMMTSVTGNVSNFTLYLNGSFYDSQIRNDMNLTTERFMFLGGTHNHNSGITGGMDEIRIYNRTLSHTEISEIYNSGRIQNSSLPSDGLVLWYGMNEGQGSILHDLAGDNNGV